MKERRLHNLPDTRARGFPTTIPEISVISRRCHGHWLCNYQRCVTTDNWQQKQWLFHLPLFAEVMPRTGSSRFTSTSTCHMTLKPHPARGNNNHIPLFKVRDMNHLLQTCFRNLYDPAQELSIDESMIPF